jgi:hypothetical protein
MDSPEKRISTKVRPGEPLYKFTTQCITETTTELKKESGRLIEKDAIKLLLKYPEQLLLTITPLILEYTRLLDSLGLSKKQKFKSNTLKYDSTTFPYITQQEGNARTLEQSETDTFHQILRKIFSLYDDDTLKMLSQVLKGHFPKLLKIHQQLFPIIAITKSESERLWKEYSTSGDSDRLWLFKKDYSTFQELYETDHKDFIDELREFYKWIVGELRSKDTEEEKKTIREKYELQIKGYLARINVLRDTEFFKTKLPHLSSQYTYTFEEENKHYTSKIDDTKEYNFLYKDYDTGLDPMLGIFQEKSPILFYIQTTDDNQTRIYYSYNVKEADIGGATKHTYTWNTDSRNYEETESTTINKEEKENISTEKIKSIKEIQSLIQSVIKIQRRFRDKKKEPSATSATSEPGASATSEIDSIIQNAKRIQSDSTLSQDTLTEKIEELKKKITDYQSKIREFENKKELTDGEKKEKFDSATKIHEANQLIGILNKELKPQTAKKPSGKPPGKRRTHKKSKH